MDDAKRLRGELRGNAKYLARYPDKHGLEDLKKAEALPAKADSGLEAAIMAEQSRRMSLVESVANVAIGYGIALSRNWQARIGLHVSLRKRRHRGDFHGREHCPHACGSAACSERMRVRTKP